MYGFYPESGLPYSSLPSVDQEIGVSDSGSGADAVSILAIVPSSDSGIGVEALGLLAFVPASDSGSGTESPDVIHFISVSDSGAGIESLAILAGLSTADSGSGTDLPGILALVSPSDAGSGVEGTPGVLSLVPSSDAGAGSEGLAILGGLSGADDGLGTDQPFILGLLAFPENGSASEAEEILATIDGSDLGAALESEEVLGLLYIAETGAGSEMWDEEADVAISDDGTGFEIALQIDEESTLFEKGAGTEGIPDVLADCALASTGTGTEATAILIEVEVEEYAGGYEALSVVQSGPVPPPKPSGGRTYGGSSTSRGGGYPSLPPSRSRDRSFAEKAIAILEERVKKTEADLFPVRTKTGSDQKRVLDLHAVKGRLKAIQEQIRELKESLKDQTPLESRVVALEERLETLDVSLGTVVQTGLVFQQVRISVEDGLTLAAFSAEDTKTLGSMAATAKAFILGVTIPAAVEVLSRHSGQLTLASKTFLGVIERTEEAARTGATVSLNGAELDALRHYLEASRDASNSFVQEGPPVLSQALVGMGLPTLFSIFIALASD